MAQQPTLFCQQCGEPLAPGQRFCTNCGTTMEQNAYNPTALAPNSSQGNRPDMLPPTQLAPPPPPSQPNRANPIQPATPATPDPRGNFYAENSGSVSAPPPPPPTFNSYASNPANPQRYPQSSARPPEYAPPPNREVNPPQAPNAGNAPGTYAPLPPYAQTPKRGRGCLITSIVLLLVLAAGIGTFVFYRSHQKTTTQVTQTNTGNPTSGNTPNAIPTSTPTPGISSTETLNLAVTYASIQLTLVSAETAQSFADDNDDTSAPGGVVRVNLKENNATSGNPEYVASSAFLLVLPDGNTVKEGDAEFDISPDAGVNRQNWIDYPLNNAVPLSQLILRIGQQTDNQMSIPLQPNANISKYQDQTSSPKDSFTYAQLDWTLKTATLSYSYDDQQATTGNLYVLVTFGVSNPTSNSFVQSPTDYMRMQAGGSTVQPDDTTTLATSIDGQSTQAGSVAFLVPQGATSFTLIMIAQPTNSPPIKQVTQTFQIP